MGTGASCVPTMSRGQNALDAKLVIGGCQRMVVEVINSVCQQSLALPFSGFCMRDGRAIYNQVYSHLIRSLAALILQQYTRGTLWFC